MGSTNGRRQFRNVSAAHPCPICGKPDWCSVSEDGEICICRRQGDPSQERTDKNGERYYRHHLPAGPPPYEPQYSLADGGGRLADPHIRHAVYHALLCCLDLSMSHQAALRRRGLKNGLKAAGYRSLPERRRYRAVRRLIDAGMEQQLPTVPGFFVQEREGRYWTVSGAAGLLIPVRDCQQRIIGLLVRPDEHTEGGKYRWLSSKKRCGPGPGAPIHVPLFKGEKSTVRVTEGALKADIATRLSGMLTIGMPGVASWRRVTRVLKELGAKSVRVALDADAVRKRAVAEALYALTHRLLDRGFAVALEVWDESDEKGIDDLLAAGKQPEVIEGEQLEVAVCRIRDNARAADPIGGGPNGVTPEGACCLTALDIIARHFRTYYRPIFRRGAVMYSEAHGRNISASEACFAASPELIDDLEIASDAPRSEHGVTRSALPKFFKTWAPVAWRGILDSLQEEEQTAEVVESAADEFRAKVAAGLHTHIVLGYRHEGKEETEVERRSLIAWACLFAKKARPGVWGQVRNYLLWCRRDDPNGPLRVALRVGLFASGQAHLRGLAELPQGRFARLCEQYGIGSAYTAEGQRIRAGGQSVVELTAEFIEELLTGPANEPPTPSNRKPPEPPPPPPNDEAPNERLDMGTPRPTGDYLGGM